MDRLALARIPRLLLVEPGCAPPVTEDVLEDWVRLPLDDAELKARLATLRRRAATLLDVPRLDRHGRLLFRGQWINLTPIEERLLARLTHRFDDVVGGSDVVAAGWPDHRPTANAVRVTMHRLRRRLQPLALELRRVGDGWLLHERQELPLGGPAPAPTPWRDDLAGAPAAPARGAARCGGGGRRDPRAHPHPGGVHAGGAGHPAARARRAGGRRGRLAGRRHDGHRRHRRRELRLRPTAQLVPLPRRRAGGARLPDRRRDRRRRGGRRGAPPAPGRGGQPGGAPRAGGPPALGDAAIGVARPAHAARHHPHRGLGAAGRGGDGRGDAAGSSWPSWATRPNGWTGWSPTCST